jgi:hypothetical protein
MKSKLIHFSLVLSSVVLFSLVGIAAAQAQSAPAPRPLPQLQNTRELIVFAPAADSPALRIQLALLERHSFELSRYNTVVVPVTATGADLSAAPHFAFEHIALADSDQQAAARARFHIGPADFAVILLNPDGSEQVRSTKPIDIHAVVASLDSAEIMGPLTASLY